MNEHAHRRRSDELRMLALLVFLQMLPATLVAPAIRPLFAALHEGREGPMHAFMSLNMLGAALAAPWVARAARRRLDRRRMVVALALADAILLGAVSLPLPIAVVLTLRTLEGAAHVSAATLLLVRAAELAKTFGHGRAMGLAGGAIIFAVASGNALGGLLVAAGPVTPFVAGVGVLLVVAASAGTILPAEVVVASARPKTPIPRALIPSVALAFVARFTVGCLVVTFALFAHGAHSLSDTKIGLLFALLTYPFALTTYPAARLGSRVPRAFLMGGSAALYAGSLAAIGFVPTGALAPVMLLSGFASAGMFASILCYASELSPPEGHGAAMSAINAAGCIGMVVGPAVAGILSAVLKVDHGAVFAQRAVFLTASAAVGLWILASLPHLTSRTRSEVASPATLRGG